MIRSFFASVLVLTCFVVGCGSSDTSDKTPTTPNSGTGTTAGTTAGTTSGATASLGTQCTAYVACCKTLETSHPEFQSACDSVNTEIADGEKNGIASSTFESSCQQGLSAFQASGSCK